MNARCIPPLPRRVLLVHQSADLYGSDRMLLAVAGWLRREGCEAIVMLPHGGPLAAALRERGVETHETPPHEVLRLARSDLSPLGLARLAAALPPAVRAIDRCLDGREVDLVYSSTLAVLAGALWSRLRGRPHVWHLHEMVQRPRLAARMLTGLVARGADVVVCNSHATQRWLLAQQPALAARSKVVWNGMDAVPAAPHDAAASAASTASTASTALAAALRPAGARLAIGLIGRINRFKGQMLLLEAMERLHAEGERGCSLVFVGSAPAGQPEHEQRLRARIAASPLAPRVVLHGFTPTPMPYYEALDIVCVPSLEAEGLGLAAIEAMAAGRAVVAADIGGLPEVVQDGCTGWLHAPGDAASLAERLRRLIQDPASRQAMGQCGLRRCSTEFTVPRMTAGLRDAFAAGLARLPA
jgi:glycosyltransferase involved in cell wall biosynthesis